MKNQCANLKKEVQEKMKSIREMKTTLEIFKRERETENMLHPLILWVCQKTTERKWAQGSPLSVWSVRGSGVYLEGSLCPASLKYRSCVFEKLVSTVRK